MSVDRETNDREKETNVSAVRETGRWGEERERAGSRDGEEIVRVSARVRERTHVWNTPKRARSDCTCPSSGKETGITKKGSERLARCSSVVGAVASAVLPVHSPESTDDHTRSQVFQRYAGVVRHNLLQKDKISLNRFMAMRPVSTRPAASHGPPFFARHAALDLPSLEDRKGMHA